MEEPVFNASAAATGIANLGTHRFFLTLALAIYVVSVPFSTYTCVYGLGMPHLSPIIRLYIASATLNVYGHLFSVNAMLLFAMTAGWRLKSFVCKRANIRNFYFLRCTTLNYNRPLCSIV